MPTINRRTVIAGTGALWTFLAAGCNVPAPPTLSGVPMAITRGRATVRGTALKYRAEAGETVLRNAAGVPRATIFSVAYLAEGVLGRNRPVTFLFNGGPGGATWNLRQAIAPKIFAAGPTARGFAFVDNPDSLIDASDLIFIDCPGTGYSRFFSDDAKPEYWGVQQDAHAVTEFIIGWLHRQGRLDSPRYILGESYGGIRTAQILEMAASWPRGAVRFSGVILISPSVGSARQQRADPVAEAAAPIPSEAVAAWYNQRGGRLSDSLEQVATQAQRFAEGPYSVALRQIDSLREDQRKSIADELSSFIGLSTDTLLTSHLRVGVSTFQDLLLADERQRVDGDSRTHHPKPPPGVAESVLQTADGYDLNAAILSMLNDELGYKPGRPYVRDPVEANRAWNYTITKGQGSMPAILKTMTEADPRFGVFLAGGYFDLVVPYLSSLSALSGLPEGQFVHNLYRSGHAVLNEPTVRPEATDNIRAFYKRR